MAAQRRKKASGTKPAQLELSLRVRTWGGARKGAGRKPSGPRRRVAHRPRPALSLHHPVHVTLRLDEGLPNLRRKAVFKVVRRALRAGAERLGCRVVHYSVQTNHLHLIVEAKGRDPLSRGMQGLKIRIARALNTALGRRGRVFGDRYHAHVLKTPREVRNALAYVLLNARKHEAQHGRRLAASWLDPFSSGAWFDGWKNDVGRPLDDDDPDVARPRTWLLAKGWRRRGLIHVAEVPRGA